VSELAYLSVGELRALLARRAVRAGELLRCVLDRIERLDPALNAFITVDADGAAAQAAAADARLAGEGGEAFGRYPLLGIPVSVKDLTPTLGLRTTRGSPALRGHVPDADAPAVARLRAAGAVIVGKTNTSEDGWSGGCVNRLHGATANPWSPALSPGGSSGGAAAAVAAGLGPVATGTDGAGSIRIPAAFCGVVGLKPSFGRVPYAPASPENLSHLGPLTRTVADAATVLDVLAGPDPRDPFSLDGPPDPAPDGPLRIAWLPGLGAPAPDAGVAELARAAVDDLAALGHRVEEIEPPFPDPYPILVTILASADAAAHRGARPGAGPDPARAPVVARGLELSAADLAAAQSARAALWERVRRCMRRFDLLATPTVPITPFPVSAHGPQPPVDKGDEPWLAWTPNTYPFNLTGQPAISVPAGLTAAGLPAGLQLVGRWRADRTVLRAAAELERARPWQHLYAALDTRWRGELAQWTNTRG
jgi:aspartyl-tRNA(Asn)/glutamyl-tRNA(Gln) amidotransferase subunit A